MPKNKFVTSKLTQKPSTSITTTTETTKKATEKGMNVYRISGIPYTVYPGEI